jgi:hypothetical protein
VRTISSKPPIVAHPVYRSTPTSPLAFPIAAVPKSMLPTVDEWNARWKNRRPFFEALLAKGADINAKDANGATPVFFLMTHTSCATEAFAWFVAKGADVLAKGRRNAENALQTPLEIALPEIRPELARLALFPKLAKPDAILVWTEHPLDKPHEIKRAAEGDAPPLFSKIMSDLMINEGAPGPDQLAFVVLHRKRPDGTWAEVKRVPLPLPPQPKNGPLNVPVEWGDVLYFSSYADPDPEEPAPKESAK